MSQRAKRYRRLEKQARALWNEAFDRPKGERERMRAAAQRVRESSWRCMPEGLVTRELRDEPRRAWSHVHRVNAAA